MDSTSRSKALSSMLYVIVDAFAYALEPMLDRDSERDWRRRDGNHAGGNGHRDTGISDLPPAVEDAQQD